MESIENLQHTLEHYEYVQARQTNQDVIKLMQPIIDKVKQDIEELIRVNKN